MKTGRTRHDANSFVFSCRDGGNAFRSVGVGDSTTVFEALADPTRMQVFVKLAC